MTTLDACAAAAAIRSRELSSLELVEDCLSRIDELDGEINSFTVVLADEARAAAREIDRRIAGGDPVGPLAGIPVAIKDHIWLEGELATNGSRALADFRPSEDAIPVARLKANGAIPIGKTNNPEFCYRGFTANDVFGTTRNPWKLERTPGGSSGGAGACVAAGMVPLALGTDGGGSVRIPAAFCGIVGLKGTFGLVPKLPGFRGWPTLSIDGPLTRSVRDAALALEATAGPHPADDLSYPSPDRAYLSAATEEPDLSRLRVAWSVDLGYAPVEADVRRNFHRAVELLGRTGVELVEAHPPPRDPITLWNTIATIEGYASEGALLERSPELIEPETAEIIRSGASRSARDYLDAQSERAAYTREWLEFFIEHDVLVTPMMQMTAFDVGIAGPAEIDGMPVDQFFDDWCHLCYPANLTGQPAISLPNGFGDDGLPVGLQMIARRFDEVTLLSMAAAWERLMPWSDQWPPLHAEPQSPSAAPAPTSPRPVR
jgi:Asp-tRNA(Asn)/Glu-tRNA(Gln) amidotransferase A subunit family amidase